MTDTQQVNVDIDIELYKRMKALKQTIGTSIASIVRNGTRKQVEQMERLLEEEQQR